MQTRPFGSSGIEASVIGLGTWAIGGWMWGGADERDSIAAIQAVHRRGRDAHRHRSRVRVRTLRGGRRQGHRRAAGRGRPVHEMRPRVGYRPRRALLRRRGSRRPSLPGPRLDRARGRGQPASPGHRRHRHLRHALAGPHDAHRGDHGSARGPQGGRQDPRPSPPATSPRPTSAEYLEHGRLDGIQERYNALDRELEDELVPLCLEHGVSIMSYSSLALGILSGKVAPERVFEGDDQRGTNPRFSAGEPCQGRRDAAPARSTLRRAWRHDGAARHRLDARPTRHHLRPLRRPHAGAGRGERQGRDRCSSRRRPSPPSTPSSTRTCPTWPEADAAEALTDRRPTAAAGWHPMTERIAPRRRALGAAPDVLIVGGGINGAGLFRELALQGVRVTLVEKGDFCSGSSAAPSRMIHGGLRYLEYGETKLVRESLRERDALLRNAPHYVRPIETVMPLYSWLKGLRLRDPEVLPRQGSPIAARRPRRHDRADLLRPVHARPAAWSPSAPSRRGAKTLADAAGPRSAGRRIGHLLGRLDQLSRAARAGADPGWRGGIGRGHRPELRLARGADGRRRGRRARRAQRRRRPRCIPGCWSMPPAAGSTSPTRRWVPRPAASTASRAATWSSMTRTCWQTSTAAWCTSRTRTSASASSSPGRARCWRAPPRCPSRTRTRRSARPRRPRYILDSLTRALPGSIGGSGRDRVDVLRRQAAPGR